MSKINLTLDNRENVEDKGKELKYKQVQENNHVNP